MRKILALVLAVAMLFTVAMVASAAPSVEAEAAPTVSGVTASDGTAIDAGSIQITAVADAGTLTYAQKEELKAAYGEIRDAASMSAFFANAGISQAVEAALGGEASANDLILHSMFDVVAKGAAQSALRNGLTITFNVPTLKAGDVAVVLHKGADGWEVVPSTTIDGGVKATFTSLSPVAILVEGTPSGYVTAPATNDIAFEGIVACCAMFCLMGAAAYRKSF